MSDSFVRSHAYAAEEVKQLSMYLHYETLTVNGDGVVGATGFRPEVLDQAF